MNNDPTSLNQIYHKLGNIEGKLDSLTHIMTSHSTQDDVRFANITVQLEDLKQTKWFNGGRASAISAIVSTAVSLAFLWFKGH
jgi:hypothetical protein